MNIPEAARRRQGASFSLSVNTEQEADEQTIREFIKRAYLKRFTLDGRDVTESDVLAAFGRYTARLAAAEQDTHRVAVLLADTLEQRDSLAARLAETHEALRELAQAVSDATGTMNYYFGTNARTGVSQETVDRYRRIVAARDQAIALMAGPLNEPGQQWHDPLNSPDDDASYL